MSKMTIVTKAERYPVISTMEEYITAESVLAYVPMENESVQDMIRRRAKAKAMAANVSIYGNAQISITLSDKPGYAYKVKTASLSWVDKEAKQQMEDEARIRYRNVDMTDDADFYAELTFFPEALKDQATFNYTIMSIEADRSGCIIDFSGYDTLTHADGQILLAMDGEHPTIYVWADSTQEDPTHIISLKDAYTGITKRG